jgi:hypothetical protein
VLLEALSRLHDCRPPRVCILRPDTREQPLLDVVQNRIMVDNRDVLRFGLEKLVGVLPGGKHVGLLGAHLPHLLGHLIRGCGGMSAFCSIDGNGENLPLSLPSRKTKTDRRPKMHRKYHEMLDIHRGSSSLVATPACSMLLNLSVRGKGSFMMT